MLKTLEELAKLQQNQLNQAKDKISKDPNTFKTLDSFENIKHVSLHPHFVQSLILRSEKRYLHLPNMVQPSQAECRFYSILENGLLELGSENIDNQYLIKFKLSSKDQPNEEKLAFVSKNDFFEILYKNKCQQNRDYQKLFTPSFIQSTINSLNLAVPKNNQECQQIMNEWLVNPYLPQICGLTEKINTYKKLNSQIPASSVNLKQIEALRRSIQPLMDKNSSFKVDYFQNVCAAIDQSDKFCSAYLSSDLWQKIVRGEKPQYLMKYKCMSLNGNYEANLNDQQYTYCAQQFTKMPDTCSTVGANDFPALFPRPNCQSIAKSQSFSRLKTNYQDCPGRVDHLGLANIHRVASHFDGRNFASTPLTCLTEMSSSYLGLLRDYEYLDGWEMKICYHDKIEQKEVCQEYVPGKSNEKLFSEVDIVAAIIPRIQSTIQAVKCSWVSEKEYNPQMLQYKNGCFIVAPETCVLERCPRKIIFNQQEVKDIKYKSNITFDYFPSIVKNTKYSLMKILEHILKIKHSTIANLTEIRDFLDKNPENIIHGIGCAEDLYPQHFRRQSINYCTPTPFIIDGYLKEIKNDWLVFRAAMDDVGSPKSVHWNAVFDALKNYQALHPSQTWTLYGIEKRL